MWLMKIDEDPFDDHVSIVLNLQIKCRIWCLHVVPYS